MTHCTNPTRINLLQLLQLQPLPLLEGSGAVDLEPGVLARKPKVEGGPGLPPPALLPQVPLPPPSAPILPLAPSERVGARAAERWERWEPVPS